MLHVRRDLAVAALTCLALCPHAASAQQIKGRVMVLIDTSGSMGQHFADANPLAYPPAGDYPGGDGSTLYTDSKVSNQSWYPGRSVNGVADGTTSRLYAAKAAVTNAINGYAADVDFGLESYSFNLCPFTNPQCVGCWLEFCNANGCTRNCTATGPNACNEFSCLYSDPGFTRLSSINWLPQGCGGSDLTKLGGNILVVPGPASAARMLPWLDGVEVHANSNDGSSALTALNACSADADCPGGAATSCRHHGCVSDATCPGGSTGGCVNGTCVAGTCYNCAVDSDCSYGVGSCIGGFCGVPCVRNADCGAGGRCTAGFCTNLITGRAPWNLGGTPANPELRANGSTPLAESIYQAQAQWFDKVKGGDPQAACRPYVLVVATDGGQSYNCTTGINGGNPGQGNPCCNGSLCSGGICGADPTAAVTALYNDGKALGNPVLTYVIGLAINNPQDSAQLNSMAAAGGTTQARFANSQADIQAAFADILAKSVKTEQCNGADDNCNSLIDEGLGVYQECAANNDCASNVCSGGRCTCATGAQCANGYVCSNKFCIPGGCSTGIGNCARNGVKKCGAANMGATCCADDNLAACAPLLAGTPGALLCKPGEDNNCNGILDINELGCMGNPCNAVPETCNAKDDDCDGIVDNHLVDVGQGCGLSVGICKPGTTTCVNSMGQDVTVTNTPDATDHLICKGAVTPQPPQCNGCDNDCDGVADAPASACYDGPAGTENVGICHGGEKQCATRVCMQPASYGSCLGQQTPQTEVCNGLDDDCNGKIDDVMGSGMPCCLNNFCGVGACSFGSMQCQAGILQCTGGQAPLPEVCNGLDDNCDGMTDNLPNLGKPCTDANGCPSQYVCDLNAQMVVCRSMQMNCNPNTGGCNNDPLLGKDCGPGKGLPMPCQPGKWVCDPNTDQLICQGGQGPSPEYCNCADDDCNGKVDDNAYCAGGTACVSCQCLGPCLAGEFPCPGGYQCINDTQSCTRDADCPPVNTCNSGRCSGYCTPLTPCNPACAEGFDCKGGTCVDRCLELACGAGYTCLKGACVETTCRTLHNCAVCANGSGGEICDVTQDPPKCIPDKCCGVECATTEEYCDAVSGRCQIPCGNTKCVDGHLCSDGVCKLTRCDTVHCPEGQACNQTTGACEVDTCLGKQCREGAVCCGGDCVIDTCPQLQCPAGTRCVTYGLDCSHWCLPVVVTGITNTQVVAAGGGGAAFGCSLEGARSGSPGSGALAWAALWLLAWIGRVGRRARNLHARCLWRSQAHFKNILRGVFALTVGGALLTGCYANPFCLDCLDGNQLTGLDMPALLVVDFTLQPQDFAGTQPDLGGPDGPCSQNLLEDPNNCGTCGTICRYPHAAGLCMNGSCMMGHCQSGFYDSDHSPVNGCEYPCSPTPLPSCAKDTDCPWGLSCNQGACQKTCAANSDCPASTICDPGTRLCEGEYCDGKDNNCDEQVDEGFDLQKDPDNCGKCSNVCGTQNAKSNCTNGVCVLGPCNTDGKGGRWYDLDGSPSNGCEYDCRVDPPKVEACNGLDDDCDGLTDNNVTGMGMTCDDYCPALAPCVAQGNCSYGLSPCAGKCCGACTEGMTTCVAGNFLCRPGVAPVAEICNRVDDNCDGQVDEGFDLRTDPRNCGSCGNACDPPNAIAACAAGHCAILSCKLGFADFDKDPANGCEYACPVNPPTVETCNGEDDDCNGIVDDKLVQPMNFCVQDFLCKGAVPVCCGAAGWLCNYPTVDARLEVTSPVTCKGGQTAGVLPFSEKLCDNLDGNCNGQTDESFLSLGKPCSVGFGACQGNANWVCDPRNPAQATCPVAANALAAVDEDCNGIDDDCDGQTDESKPVAGLTCYNGGVHPCKGWSDQMTQIGSIWVYSYEASRPDATSSAGGLSAARACSRPAVLPWTTVSWKDANAACAALTDSSGANMRLCTAAEWTNACSNGGAGTWSYSTNAGVYQSATCNGVDAAVSAVWPGGTGAMCHPANANVYDLSGNVAEWTATPACLSCSAGAQCPGGTCASGCCSCNGNAQCSMGYTCTSGVCVYNTSYYKVRGGSFGTSQGGTECGLDFVILAPNYAYSDLGFRCCADHAP